jgi:hypothetical protein
VGGLRLAMTTLRGLSIIALAASLMLPLGEASASETSSAAKQKKPRVHKQAVAPKPVYRWRPADPSFDQNGRLYKPPPGLPCPIDLGYGRWTSCMWDR